MADIVYILTNESMPGIVKIGRTNGDSVETRMKQLDTTSVPLPFECFYACEVADANRVERAIHTAFGDHRVRANREFFRLSPDKPKAIMELLSLKNITPRGDVVTEPTDQAALDRAKTRAPNFRFSMIGIKPGAELRSVFDEDVSCKVIDDKKVEFEGEEYSISGAALKVAHNNGYTWNQIAGPAYWKYEGRTLTELRDDSINVSDDEHE